MNACYRYTASILCQHDFLETRGTQVIGFTGFNFQCQNVNMSGWWQSKKGRFYSLTIIQNIFDTPHMGNADGLSGCESENYF